MAGYRLYFLTEEGRIKRSLEIDVSNDEAALEKAWKLDHAHCIEVWCGKRKVGIVDPLSR